MKMCWEAKTRSEVEVELTKLGIEFSYEPEPPARKGFVGWAGRLECRFPLFVVHYEMYSSDLVGSNYLSVFGIGMAENGVFDRAVLRPNNMTQEWLLPLREIFFKEVPNEDR